MRFALEIMTVLEGAGLALVAVDREIARRGAGPDKLPFAMAGKTGAAETAQARLVELGHDRIDRELAVPAGGELGIATGFDISFERLVSGDDRMSVAGLGGSLHRFCRGMVDMAMADLGDGSRGAATHAGCPHHPHLLRIGPLLQCLHESSGPHHLASQAVTDPNSQAWRRRLPFLDRVEMGVKGRDFVDFGLRKAHFFGKGAHMGCGQVAEAVLDQMQKLDQEIPIARAVAEQVPDLDQRLVVELPALGMGSAFPFTTSGMSLPSLIATGRCHALPRWFFGIGYTRLGETTRLGNHVTPDLESLKPTCPDAFAPA